MSYNLKPDNDNICQCECIINKYYMSIYFKAAKYQSSVRRCVCVCVSAALYAPEFNTRTVTARRIDGVLHILFCYA